VAGDVNEAAERLFATLPFSDQDTEGRQRILIQDALAAERRATVERVKGVPDLLDLLFEMQTGYGRSLRARAQKVLAILDAEADR